MNHRSPAARADTEEDHGEDRPAEGQNGAPKGLERGRSVPKGRVLQRPGDRAGVPVPEQGQPRTNDTAGSVNDLRSWSGAGSPPQARPAAPRPQGQLIVKRADVNRNVRMRVGDPFTQGRGIGNLCHPLAPSTLRPESSLKRPPRAPGTRPP